jgi:hypothetical protein
LSRWFPSFSETRRSEEAVSSELLKGDDRLRRRALLAQQSMGVELAQRQVQGQLELTEYLRRPVVGGSCTDVGIERRQARQERGSFRLGRATTDGFGLEPGERLRRAGTVPEPQARAHGERPSSESLGPERGHGCAARQIARRGEVATNEGLPRSREVNAGAHLGVGVRRQWLHPLHRLHRVIVPA